MGNFSKDASACGGCALLLYTRQTDASWCSNKGPRMAAFSCLAAVWLNWLWSSGLCSERGLRTFPYFCCEFKLTTMFSLKWESYFLHSCKPSKNYLVSIVQPAMWIIFCPEVKKKKIVSLDHCLPVQSMPLTRPADKREDIMQSTGTAV